MDILRVIPHSSLRIRVGLSLEGSRNPTAVWKPGYLTYSEALRLCAPPHDGFASLAAYGFAREVSM